ncbi:hypothetical protein M9H77_11991 [Catharanthus roseus]|uniref:Uncharacterized protein n=1 Tax=Catharanthus roseus TaxID=4058 RepID=A0ACC0BG76_CATRO|nr:hypothetical protein M9H77_11991 [Catharanthus roseus]
MRIRGRSGRSLELVFPPDVESSTLKSLPPPAKSSVSSQQDALLIGDHQYEYTVQGKKTILAAASTKPRRYACCDPTSEMSVHDDTDSSISSSSTSRRYGKQKLAPREPKEESPCILV